MISVVAVGKKHDTWVQPGLERYQKRLQQPYNTNWILLPHSHHEGDRARLEESERILRRLDEDSYAVLLDETGKQFTSPSLADLCEWQFSHGRSVVFIIGGAYGVSAELIKRVDAVWSLSKLVFPHQLVRLILIEQLYRAQEIARGGGYHHS